jgi:hypothetical protein
MNDSSNNNPNILDLPDEILFIIFEKLNRIDVFYSLVHVNQRFNRLIFDPLCLRDLNMTINYQTSPTDTQVLSTIDQTILLRIHQHVHKLTVEQCLMKEILLVASYPQLFSLSLTNFQEKRLHQYLKSMLILH